MFRISANADTPLLPLPCRFCNCHGPTSAGPSGPLLPTNRAAAVPVIPWNYHVTKSCHSYD